MESVIKFQSPSTGLIVGPSGSGKSTFVYEALKNAGGVFACPPKAVYYCHGVYQPLYDVIQSEVPNINFIEELPTKHMLETWNMEESGHKLLILDDVMQEGAKSKDVVDIFCKYSHHLNFTCWFLCQNLFNASKEYRCISLNAHYLILFRQKRDQNQISILARQIFGSDKFFLDAYKKATSTQYGYIVLDLSPHSVEDYKVRTNIFPHQSMIVYQPEKTK